MSGFKVGDQGKQKESGWSGQVSKGEREGRNLLPPTHLHLLPLRIDILQCDLLPDPVSWSVHVKGAEAAPGKGSFGSRLAINGINPSEELW